MENTAARPTAQMQNPRFVRVLIWWAMVTALLTYAIIAYVAAVAPDNGPKIIEGVLIPLRNGLCALMVFSFFLGVLFPKVLPRKAGVDWTQNIWVFVFQLLLHEGVAFFGFLITMLTFHGEYSLIGGVLGILGMAMIYPRKNTLKFSK